VITFIKEEVVESTLLYGAYGSDGGDGALRLIFTLSGLLEYSQKWLSFVFSTGFSRALNRRIKFVASNRRTSYECDEYEVGTCSQIQIYCSKETGDVCRLLPLYSLPQS